MLSKQQQKQNKKLSWFQHISQSHPEATQWKGFVHLWKTGNHVIQHNVLIKKQHFVPFHSGTSELFLSLFSFQAGPLCFLFLLICISSSTSSLSLYFSAGFSSSGAALWQMVVLPESCDSDLRMALNKVTCTFLLLLRHKLIACL